MAEDPENDSWQGLGSLSPESDKHKQLQRLLSRANFSYLEARSLTLRRKLHTALDLDLKCSVNATRFASGFNNAVFEIEFSDSVRWIARVPYREFNDADRISMLSEIDTMKMVKKKTTIPIACVFDFEAAVCQDLAIRTY